MGDEQPCDFPPRPFDALDPWRKYRVALLETNPDLAMATAPTGEALRPSAAATRPLQTTHSPRPHPAQLNPMSVSFSSLASPLVPPPATLQPFHPAALNSMAPPPLFAFPPISPPSGFAQPFPWTVGGPYPMLNQAPMPSGSLGDHSRKIPL